MLLSVWCVLTNPRILGYCQYDWLNNLRLGQDLGLGLSLGRVMVRVKVWIVWYMDAQTAARFGSTDPY